MTVLKYKDFQGSVSFEDGTLVLQILHIDDLIVAECDSASKVEKTFRELVDDYLETCAATGKEPCKSYRGSFNVRVDPHLHKEAAMSAAAERVSLNAWVESAMRERLNQTKLSQEMARLLATQYKARLGIGPRHARTEPLKTPDYERPFHREMERAIQNRATVN
jgi:predicted HicB family RNase H-like nuclease